LIRLLRRLEKRIDNDQQDRKNVREVFTCVGKGIIAAWFTHERKIAFIITTACNIQCFCVIGRSEQRESKADVDL